MIAVQASTRIDTAVARLDAWLDTMHGPGGYGGPVCHWWQQSLLYTGPGLDWRYEGIIAGYLHLWERTGDRRWLAKARRAGDDLVAGQQPDGHYPASGFEINPATAGTPHEAAADAGLLLLALALRQAGESNWENYRAVAEHNIQAFYLDQLWDGEAQAFRDDPTIPSFVPNKAATACEALFLLSTISGDDSWVEIYALPTLQRILAHQVLDRGPLQGAVAQNSFGRRVIAKYFPIYIARCVNALLQGYTWTHEARYADAALEALRFVARWCYPDGSFPTVVYPNNQVNRYPSWIAPLGDILRAADLLKLYGFDANLQTTEARLLAGQDDSGGIQTATGFGSQAGGPLSAFPDPRDLLHVAGWCDKAFRYLAAQTGPDLLAGAQAPFTASCRFRGKTLQFCETATILEMVASGGICYYWRKGEPWAQVADAEFWLR